MEKIMSNTDVRELYNDVLRTRRMIFLYRRAINDLRHFYDNVHHPHGDAICRVLQDTILRDARIIHSNKCLALSLATGRNLTSFAIAVQLEARDEYSPYAVHHPKHWTRKHRTDAAKRFRWKHPSSPPF